MSDLVKYYMGVDPGIGGGAALVSVDVDGVFDVESVIPFDRMAREYVAADVWSWFILHKVRQIVIEKVGARSGQAGQTQLVHTLGWWDGVCSMLGAVPMFIPPNQWKPRAGIPPMNNAPRHDRKLVAVRRAEEIFPGVSFRGKRGGISGTDWMAEAALMALTGWQHEQGVRPFSGKIYDI